jgi:hypothetical protein
VDGLLDGWVGWMNGWMNGWMIGCMDAWTIKTTDRWRYECRLHRLTNRQTRAVDG